MKDKRLDALLETLYSQAIFLNCHYHYEYGHEHWVCTLLMMNVDTSCQGDIRKCERE